MPPPLLVLVCGPPGCGKTSTAEELAAKLKATIVHEDAYYTAQPSDNDDDDDDDDDSSWQHAHVNRPRMRSDVASKLVNEAVVILEGQFAAADAELSAGANFAVVFAGHRETCRARRIERIKDAPAIDREAESSTFDRRWASFDKTWRPAQEALSSRLGGAEGPFCCLALSEAECDDKSPAAKSLDEVARAAAGMINQARHRRIAAVVPQKSAEVQALVRAAGFGPPDSEVVAPCGLMAMTVARLIATRSLDPATAISAVVGVWPELEEALRPLADPAVILPALAETWAEVAAWRRAYLTSPAHLAASELTDDDAQDRFLRDLVGPFEVSAWLRRNGSLRVAFLRNVQCGSEPSLNGFVRWGANEDEIPGLLAVEAAWIKEEASFRSPTTDFLIETAVGRCPDGPRGGAEALGFNLSGGYRLRTLEQWARDARAELVGGGGGAVPVVLDYWGHYAVYLPALVGGAVTLVRLDSSPVGPADYDPQFNALLEALLTN